MPAPRDYSASPATHLTASATYGEAVQSNVVYVATGSNTIYAIDATATNGEVLLSRNLGRPVPISALPGRCNNNGPNVGITSTPVIDLATRTMYVIAYTRKNDNTSTYYVHALDLQNLADRVAAVEVSASHSLIDGSTFNFDANVQRQRAGLVMANGNIYAGFASFCDLRKDVSRGWLLGWKASSLEPLPATQLNNRIASPDSPRLSSIWMSGYGIAADASGDLFFSVGNSDKLSCPSPCPDTPDTYNPPDNIQESVVKMSGDLTKILDYFTPYNHHGLDQADFDLGAGGVLLLPEQPGPIPRLAATAGKFSPVYLLNRDNLGKYGAGGKDQVVGTADAGGWCWCGPSYFRGSDGVGRLVTSGGTFVIGGDNYVIVWQDQTSPPVKLVQASKSENLPSGHLAGFFTTVSSKGTTAETAIIWAIARPTPKTDDLTLYAINPENGLTLYSQAAGKWSQRSANPNIVPVVANGRVYVASDKELAVFGLGGTVRTPPQIVADIVPPRDKAGPRNQVIGKVVKVEGFEITLQTRTGRQVRVDSTAAEKAYLSAGVFLGGAIQVGGTIDSAGVMHAEVILRARNSPAYWEADY